MEEWLALHLQSHNVGVALLVQGAQGIKGVLPPIVAGYKDLGVLIGEPLQKLQSTDGRMRARQLPMRRGPQHIPEWV